LNADSGLFGLGSALAIVAVAMAEGIVVAPSLANEVLFLIDGGMA